MKIIKGLIILFFLSGICHAEISTSLWNTQKSQHFIVYYQEAPLEYIDELISRAEDYYQSITEELGFTRFQDFWTWDKRAKIHLFKDKEAYLKTTNQPSWSAANVHILKREIYTYINMEDFFEIILPHELGHIIFREFIGYKRKLPLWLDEGVVSYLEKKKREERLMMARAMVKTAFFMSLEELEKVEKGSIIMPQVFYAESASIIEFFIKAYARDKFVDFCRRLRELRDDQNWSVALFEVYKFKSLSEMNGKWQEFLLQ